MNAALLIASLVFPAVGGFLLVSAVGGDALTRRLWLRFCLGVGAGQGVASIKLFIWTVVAGSVSRLCIVGEVVATMILVYLFLHGRSRRCSQFQAKKPTDLSLGNAILALVFLGTFAIQVSVWVSLALRDPHGGWDAWA